MIGNQKTVNITRPETWGQAEWENSDFRNYVIQRFLLCKECVEIKSGIEAENKRLEKRCETQEKYITELEKQLTLLHKTLDIIYKNKELEEKGND